MLTLALTNMMRWHAWGSCRLSDIPCQQLHRYVLLFFSAGGRVTSQRLSSSDSASVSGALRSRESCYRRGPGTRRCRDAAGWAVVANRNRTETRSCCVSTVHRQKQLHARDSGRSARSWAAGTALIHAVSAIVMRFATSSSASRHDVARAMDCSSAHGKLTLQCVTAAGLRSLVWSRRRGFSWCWPQEDAIT